MSLPDSILIRPGAANGVNELFAPHFSLDFTPVRAPGRISRCPPTKFPSRRDA